MCCCVQADVAVELEALEASLPVSVIVLYRVLAEHRMQQADALPSADGESAQQTVENARCVRANNAPQIKDISVFLRFLHSVSILFQKCRRSYSLKIIHAV